MSKLIKVLFGVYVVAVSACAFPVLAPATESPPIIFKAVISDTAMIDGLNAGILAGPGRTIEVNHAPPVEGFDPNSTMAWACQTVEDLLDVLVPDMTEFQVLIQEKFAVGQCFRAPPGSGGFAVERLEKMTRLPAEGSRHELIIWSARDSQGAIAYGAWEPDAE